MLQFTTTSLSNIYAWQLISFDEESTGDNKGNKITVPVITAVASFFVILTAVMTIWIIAKQRARGMTITVLQFNNFVRTSLSHAISVIGRIIGCRYEEKRHKAGNKKTALHIFRDREHDQQLQCCYWERRIWNSLPRVYR